LKLDALTCIRWWLENGPAIVETPADWAGMHDATWLVPFGPTPSELRHKSVASHGHTLDKMRAFLSTPTHRSP